MTTTLASSRKPGWLHPFFSKFRLFAKQASSPLRTHYAPTHTLLIGMHAPTAQVLLKEFVANEMRNGSPIYYVGHLDGANAPEGLGNARDWVDLDNPALSVRYNPMPWTSIPDVGVAHEIAQVLLVNLNPNWREKMGDFFVEAAFSYTTALIWFLRTQDARRAAASDSTEADVCTLPHLVKLAQRPPAEVLPTLARLPELTAVLRPFSTALDAKAFDQLEGQLAVVRVVFSQLDTPANQFILAPDRFQVGTRFCPVNSPRTVRADSRGSGSSPLLGLFAYVLLKSLRSGGQSDEPQRSVFLDAGDTYVPTFDSTLAVARSRRLSLYCIHGHVGPRPAQFLRRIEFLAGCVGTCLVGSYLSRQEAEVLTDLPVLKGRVSPDQVVALDFDEYTGWLAEGRDQGRTITARLPLPASGPASTHSTDESAPVIPAGSAVPLKPDPSINEQVVALLRPA